MPERVGIPGFRRGRRYVAISGTPEFFNLYEADSPEVLSGQDYLDRLNAPTAWTQRVVPSFRNVARSICRVAFTNGVGSGGVDADAALRDRCRAPRQHVDALRRRVLPPLVYRKGIAGVHLCLADEAASNVETAERKARADATLVPSLDRAGRRHRGAGCGGRADDLVPALTAHGAAAPRARGLPSRSTRALKTPWSAGV